MIRRTPAETEDRTAHANPDAARATDEPLLDHHIEEVLSALSDLDRLLLQARPETSR